MLTRMQSNWKAHTLMVRKHYGTDTLKNSLSVFYKVKYTLMT